jgi:hypothetical protein
MKETEPAGGCGGSAGITLFVYTLTTRIVDSGSHKFTSGVPYSRFSQRCGSRQGMNQLPSRRFRKLDWN